MKKIFDTPKCDLVLFEEQDIVTASISIDAGGDEIGLPPITWAKIN